MIRGSCLHGFCVMSGSSMVTSSGPAVLVAGPREWIRLTLSGIPGVSDGLPGAAAWPPDWGELGYADYLYRAQQRAVQQLRDLGGCFRAG